MKKKLSTQIRIVWDKIIRLLLVHDLPEVYIGDIPAKKAG